MSMTAFWMLTFASSCWMLTLTSPVRIALPKFVAVAFWVVFPDVTVVPPVVGAEALPPADGAGVRDVVP